MQVEIDDTKVSAITAHAHLERDKDWDGALQTMVEAPIYEWFPYRLRVSGHDAIKVMWERTLVLPCLNYETGREVLSLERCYNENRVVDIVHNRFSDDEGTAVESTFLCIFKFDGDKIVDETIHLDVNMTPCMDVVFADPAFLALDGVERF